MKRIATFLIAAAMPAVACAQSRFESVTPRDIAYYMANPRVLQQTQQVCHGNAAYMALPDCANAESAGAGLLSREYRRAANRPNVLNLYDPGYWSTNPIARDGILAQCRRRGPGDELAYPYCKAAGSSKLSELRR